jgi:hypothetical protein
LTGRRSVLAGLGAGGGVLFSGLWRAVRAADEPPPRRVAFLFYANGSHHAWTPAGTGAAFTLTPHLAPLESVRDDIIILRDMALARGRGNAHKASTLAALGAGGATSIDQLLAASVKGTTPLTSLELTIGFTGGGGGQVPSLSQSNGVFLPGERNPFAAFQRVASRAAPGPGTSDVAAVDRLLAARRSVLDHLREDVSLFRARLPAAQRARADLYLESVRDLEKSLGHAAADIKAVPACGRMMPPADTANFVARVADMPKVSRLTLDVMAMALACGVTRVTSMMWGGGESDEPVEFMGLRDWHITTHGDPGGAPGQKVIKMQAYLMGELVYFIQKLKSYTDGSGGTLLDSTLVVCGTQNGNTNQTNFAKEDHDRRNTPFILGGSFGGLWRTGRVVDCGGVNHNDLYLSIAQGFGLKVETVGDPEWCTGPLAALG